MAQFQINIPEFDVKTYWKKAVKVWKFITESKTFNFIKLVSLCAISGYLAYFVPKSITTSFTNMNGEFASVLIKVSFAGFTTFSAVLIKNFIFLTQERELYEYLIRNGENSFDYQEDFKKLSPWQKNTLITFKSFIYVLIFVLAYHSQ